MALGLLLRIVVAANPGQRDRCRDWESDKFSLGPFAEQKVEDRRTTMNSRIDHMVGLAKRGALAIALSTAMVALTAPGAFASGGTWALDSDASEARLFQGS